MANLHRIHFAIVVSKAVFGSRCFVTIEPRLCTRPSISFASRDEALVYAAELARVEGWPIRDETGEGKRG
jgi:hypothetical protein